MKIVFFGTPEFVIPILSALHKKFRIASQKPPIVAVVTQRPKPTGRKQIMSYSAVDTWAFTRKIPKFFEPQDLIKNKIDADLGILAAYGKIIPKKVIEYFPLGILNIHPSLLPKYRGASPVQAAIASGETETGVSIIKLDEKLDHGPTLTQSKEEIKTSDTGDSLRNRLFEKSADIICEMLPAYVAGKINLKAQDDSKASFTKSITKDDGFLPSKIISDVITGKKSRSKFEIKFIKDFKILPDAEFVERFIRAMTSWPGVWTIVKMNSKEMRLKILSAILEDNKFIIEKVQLEGKSAVSWKQFKDGHTSFKL